MKPNDRVNRGPPNDLTDGTLQYPNWDRMEAQKRSKIAGERTSTDDNFMFRQNFKFLSLLLCEQQVSEDDCKS